MKQKRVLSAAVRNNTIGDIENYITEQEKSPEHGLENTRVLSALYNFTEDESVSAPDHQIQLVKKA